MLQTKRFTIENIHMDIVLDKSQYFLAGNGNNDKKRTVKGISKPLGFCFFRTSNGDKGLSRSIYHAYARPKLVI